MAAKSNVHDTKQASRLARFIKASETHWWQILGPFLFIALFSWAFHSLVFGLAMTINMVLHELGHAFFFGRNNILWKILWLFPLGAVAMPENAEENEKSDQISWWRLVWLMLAGPTINVALMFFGVSLLTSVPPTAMLLGFSVVLFGQAFITSSGYLLALNLIPWGSLDAGQTFKLIFSSLTERQEYVLLGAIALAIVVFWAGLFGLGGTSVLITLFTNFAWVLSTVVILITVVISSRKDDESHATSKLAMSGTQAAVATIMYFALVVLTLVLWTGFPVIPL